MILSRILLTVNNTMDLRFAGRRRNHNTPPVAALSFPHDMAAAGVKEVPASASRAVLVPRRRATVGGAASLLDIALRLRNTCAAPARITSYALVVAVGIGPWKLIHCCITSDDERALNGTWML